MEGQGGGGSGHMWSGNLTFLQLSRLLVQHKKEVDVPVEHTWNKAVRFCVCVC